MPTQLLNDDGTASMATAMMSSHHAFRRDLACFADAVAAIARGKRERAAAVAEEWTKFRSALHHHHVMEDTAIFPDVRGKQPDLGARLDQLDAQHRAIDPLLEAGDRTFADLAQPEAAAGVVRDLTRLLAEHLELEEPAVIPHLRAAREFPVPPDDATAALYADGFAWSTAGLAPSVITAIARMLPREIVDRMAAARRVFDARCIAVWGHAHSGASLTSAPAR